MIKRRFYRFEHGDKDAPSETSSSSDSEVEAQSTEEAEVEGDEDEVKVKDKNQSLLTSSGYESEDSSANEVNLDSSGLPTSDDDTGIGNRHARQIVMNGHLSEAGDAESFDIQHNAASKDGDLAECVLKCKSVYKCRICPRIVCLTEESLQAHLKSKKHARSEKLLEEGRLKLMLNDKGKVEGDTPEKKPDLEEEDTPFTTKQKRKRLPRIADKWLRRNKSSRKYLAKMDGLNGD